MTGKRERQRAEGSWKTNRALRGYLRSRALRKGRPEASHQGTPSPLTTTSPNSNPTPTKPQTSPTRLPTKSQLPQSPSPKHQLHNGHPTLLQHATGTPSRRARRRPHRNTSPPLLPPSLHTRQKRARNPQPPPRISTHRSRRQDHPRSRI